jgi:hypothetical protein
LLSLWERCRPPSGVEKKPAIGIHFADENVENGVMQNFGTD